MRRPAVTVSLHAWTVRVTLVALAALVVPSAAAAAGMALRWNSCKGESNRNFACDRSTGSEVLVGSFMAPSTINLSGVEVNLRITTADGNVPSWWQMSGAGRCRATSLSTSFDMSAETDCDDPWMGQAGGGIGYYDTRPPNNWPGQEGAGVYLRMAMAVPQEAVQPIAGGRQYAAFRMMINHSRSSGPGACEGCTTPVCISLDFMKLTTPSDDPDKNKVARTHDVDLTTGISGMGGAANVVLWQGGTPTCGAGAAKPSTWSELKRRYK
jgi:hypothetical protein